MKMTKITLLLATIAFFAVCIVGAFLLTHTMKEYKDKANTPQLVPEGPEPPPQNFDPATQNTEPPTQNTEEK